MAGLLAGVLAAGFDGTDNGWAVLALPLVTAAIGLVDDLKGTPVVRRLLGQ